jgi:hypothetical protein
MSARDPRVRRRQRSSSLRASKPRNRALRVESLEPRVVMTGNGISSLLAWYPLPPDALNRGLASTNAAPTVAQAMCINNNAAVTGRSASLSVLGKDDGGEANLRYAWSVVSAPSGGAAAFSLNGSNAAKHTTATFTAAGTYTFSVRITDARGLSVNSSRSVVVAPTLTGLSITTGSGQAVGASPLLVSGTSQALVACGTDQFGKLMATQPALTWSTATLPTGAPAPIWIATGNGATVQFGKA